MQRARSTELVIKTSLRNISDDHKSHRVLEKKMKSASFRTKILGMERKISTKLEKTPLEDLQQNK